MSKEVHKTVAQMVSRFSECAAGKTRPYDLIVRTCTADYIAERCHQAGLRSV